MFMIDDSWTYSLVALHVGRADTREHDLLPRFTSGRPEQDEQGPEERLEVVVPVDVRVVVLGDPAEHLHPDDAVDEEDERDQDGDPGKSLEWLEEGPEQSSDSFIFVKKLHQTSNTEKSEKSDRGVTVWLQIIKIK